jgi:3-(3-hydroxy-phenyl)propionate hydroxylase
VGQGLVAGLRDVANLAWKLAWVVRGQARPQLLDSYTRERQPHVKAMINMAQLMGRLVMPGNHVAAFLTHGLMKAITSVPRLRDLFENLEAKPANRFNAGCFVAHQREARLKRGGQLPQVWLRDAGCRQVVLSDDALGGGFVMLGFGVDPRQGLTPEQLARWQALEGRFLRLNPRGVVMPAQADVEPWEDFAGALMPAVVPVGWVAIARPDKTVMVDGPAERCAALLDEAMALFSPLPAGDAGRSSRAPVKGLGAFS